MPITHRASCAARTPDAGGCIGELLVQLKWMLINRLSNAQVELEVVDFVKGWKGQAAPDACAVSRWMYS
jgi:hypothetical protein